MISDDSFSNVPVTESVPVAVDEAPAMTIELLLSTPLAVISSERVRLALPM